ncbi:MAG TPA: thioredoxin family protein [Candidatus Cloacimonas sp.]|jgi:small redox-active disulfide protein 2|nr:thioredoxin family protein [Candidatus Cloacimonas sp.]
MIIKILGSGCPKCKKLEKNAREAVEQAGVEAEVEKVTDMNDIMDYGVMITPALVIDEKVVSAGRVLSAKKIVEILNQ